jgi:ABC-type multidrug transport system fused ATPase/permease subunit
VQLQVVKNYVKGDNEVASFIIMCLFGTIVAVVWYGVQLSYRWRNLSGRIIYLHFVLELCGTSSGGIAELYAQMQKAMVLQNVFFELLEETPENISSKHNINTEKKGT